MYKALFIIFMLTMNLIAPAQAELEDPTRPPIATQKKAPVAATSVQQNEISKWVLRSTLVSSQRRTAVINDHIVIQGDEVDGASVLDIQQGQVKLSVKGKNITLSLSKEDVKTVIRHRSPQILKTSTE